MKKISLFFIMLLVLMFLFIPAFTSVGSMPGESISMIDTCIESEVLIEASDIRAMNSEKNFNFNPAFTIDNLKDQDVCLYEDNIYTMINQAIGNIRMESDFNIRFS